MDNKVPIVTPTGQDNCRQPVTLIVAEQSKQGYATEAAQEVLKFAFTTLNLHEVVSFTALANHRSKAVMQKIGMHDGNQNYIYPYMQVSNPLCEHVLYKFSKSEWLQNVS